MFHGAITALVTPFNKDGSLDMKAFQSLVEWQIAEGINGLLACGSTGETPTITFEERKIIIKSCLTLAHAKVPVMVGTGSNCTRTTIEYTKSAKELGANAALIVAPYYNKPTQEGLYQHYKAVSDAVDIPIYIYNIPGRSVVNISDETIARISELKNIKGLKDSTGTADRVISLKKLLKNNDFIQLCGDDPLAIEFNKNGGLGCISVASNILPKECTQIQTLLRDGNISEAEKLQNKLSPLYEAIFCETNPSPTKYALSLMNKMNDNVRLPLVGLQNKSKEFVEKTLRDLCIL